MLRLGGKIKYHNVTVAKYINNNIAGMTIVTCTKYSHSEIF